MESQCFCNPPKVIYKMRETIPRLQHICACRDCCERGEVCAWASEHPSKMPTRMGPCHIVLMGNSVKEIVGLENVKIMKLRDNSIAACHVATCCKATIAVRHPEPGPHSFPAPADCCNIVCDDETIARDSCTHRVFVGDFD